MPAVGAAQAAMYGMPLAAMGGGMMPGAPHPMQGAHPALQQAPHQPQPQQMMQVAVSAPQPSRGSGGGGRGRGGGGGGGRKGGGGRGGGGAVVSNETHRDLVQRVKRLQREDEAQRQLWWQWCDATGWGIRDPKRHNAQFIMDFFDALARNAVPDVPVKVSSRKTGPGGSSSGPCGPISIDLHGLAAVKEDAPLDQLVNAVKDGQRQSPAWKRRWWQHCDKSGGGIRDPNRHERAFLLQFLREVVMDDEPGEEQPVESGQSVAVQGQGGAGALVAPSAVSDGS